MRVVFECDDRPASGLGHVMRCGALAGALRAQGHLAEFSHDAYAGADFIVADTYAAQAADFARLAAIAPLCVIDDLADRDLRKASLIVNQNFGAELLDYGNGPELLLGPHYAMLRPEFVQARGARREFRATDNRVLITLGGGDVADGIAGIVTELERVPFGLEILVAGADPVDPPPSRHSVSYVARVDDMAAAMKWCDVAVTAAGVTALESAISGVPGILIVLAPNQAPGAAAAGEFGTAVVLGAPAQALPRVASEVAGLLQDPARRQAMSRAGQSAVDGNGSARVIAALEAFRSTPHSRS